jgi:hypothetical protein
VSRFEFKKWMVAQFPRLIDYTITSEPTTDYNCIAWAAGDNTLWWWPHKDSQDSYWPEGVPRSNSLNAFEAAYATLGYVRCAGPDLEEGFEKIAIFADHGKCTHAALQLSNGRWTSKMGTAYDIEHDLPTMNGGFYGQIVRYMKRPRST